MKNVDIARIPTESVSIGAERHASLAESAAYIFGGVGGIGNWSVLLETHATLVGCGPK